MRRTSTLVPIGRAARPQVFGPLRHRAGVGGRRSHLAAHVVRNWRPHSQGRRAFALLWEFGAIEPSGEAAEMQAK